MDYKNTLNLPKTNFPMKANLPQKEPDMLKHWEDTNIYQAVRESSQGHPLYILHDGPPYANGNIHLGTALNKVIKDILLKSKTMLGFDCVYVPGWDCHGLPIEHQVDKELGEKKAIISQVEKRRACREYAEKFLDLQRSQFKRLGVFGDWDNPYITMDYDYEATTVEEFGRLYLADNVYKGKKPVYWCATCKTALAEAEVEYAPHHTPSIYVKFAVVSDIAQVRPKLAGEKVHFVIWTTTPWTIPANLAIALHESFIYVAVKVRGEILIVARELLDYCLDAFGYRHEEYEIVDEFPGEVMEMQRCRHPLTDRESLLILAPFVTLDAGTGCVHIAPGHGQEDYDIGMKYGLENYAPVDVDGNFTEDVAFFAGQFVFDANDGVIDKLREMDALMGSVMLEHSYPHCWRCKQPIIFRSTEQWFISMDKTGLREKALQAVKQVKWIPSWGHDRMFGMIENRPDWCISRQRLWGVPITIFYCERCDQEILTKDILDHLVSLVREHGADVWFERDAADLIRPGTTCPACGHDRFRKDSNILDVWFDSGVSHAAALEKRPELSSPSDLYLEGNDQFRGWFQSSLLTSIGTRGRAPYRGVLTHGFLVDGDGKKMSKSLGNVISSEEIIEKYGAEILRLWLASEDYTEDIRVSEEILKRLVDAYRRIRNTGRYILGNLDGFDPQRDLLAHEKLLEMDRWALHRLQEVIGRVRAAYESFQFHAVYYTLYNFCAVDLSALYLDVLKDRLYTSEAASVARLSAQTAMYHILDALVKLTAPILTFTAEEIWMAMPDYEGKARSVHVTQLPQVEEKWMDEELAQRWRTMITMRGEISKVMETARQAKIIGHSLDVSVSLYLPAAIARGLEGAEEEMRSLLIVSQLRFLSRDQLVNPVISDVVEGLMISVAKAEGEKCNRCWIYSPTVGENSEHPTICRKCAETVVKMS